MLHAAGLSTDTGRLSDVAFCAFEVRATFKRSRRGDRPTGRRPGLSTTDSSRHSGDVTLNGAHVPRPDLADE